jgi:5-methyltetrahydrofolate--homocysteine methyltransferase
LIVIGEKINGTIPAAKKIIVNRDEKGLVRLAESQAKAGANYIDVNVAVGAGDPDGEIADMQWAVKAICAKVKKPLCIDSADPRVLEAGLKAAGDNVLLNSTTAEEKSLAPVAALAREHGVPFIGLVMDENGIPPTIEGRLDACEKIVRACEDHTIGLENVYFDPLVLPMSTDAKQGLITLGTLSAIKRRHPEAKSVLGLSNASFGLPGRMNINRAFLLMAIHAGLDAALLDPMEKMLMEAVRTGTAIMGKDRHFRKYMRMYR